MCGIAGFVDDSLKPQKATDIINSMLKETSHRGPDFCDTWIEFPVVFGHNRLSIIDLSVCGNQPMHYKNFTIVYNGELYNYIELKVELSNKGYEFSTHSDTEVLLAAYCEWKEDCVQRFVGMWAFAIWDKVEKILFCSRDRFGIKPFNYIYHSNAFYFSSEIKALKMTPHFNSEINDKQILRFLQLGWATYKDESFYNSIKILPEACNLIFRNGNVEIKKYWDISQKSITVPGSFEERAELFRNMFMDSVKLHFRSDVEVGTCLSGGLDSSAIISVAAFLYPDKKIKAFNIFYEGKGDVDEREFVYEVAKKYKNIEPYYYSPDGKELAEELNNIIYYADTPLAGSSFISQYFVMKLAKQNKVKVLLDGQGSDEYLAGYMHSFNRLIGYYIRKKNLEKALSILFKHKKEHQLSLSEAIMVLLKGIYSSSHNENEIFNYEQNRLNPLLHQEFRRTKKIIILEDYYDDAMKNFFYHLLNNTSLPTLLHYEDRNSMAFSIESRVPFLDHRLVQYSFALPIEAKIYKAETKYILRQSLNGILPDVIKNRKDKKGFVTPGESKWLRGPLKSLLDEDLSELNKWIMPNSLQKLLDDYKMGNDSNSKLIWRLVMLNRWLHMK